MQLDTKICGMCKTEKEIDKFNKSRKTRDGLHAWCAECCRAAERARYQIVKEERRKEIREWQKANPERTREYKRNWYENNKPTKEVSED